MTGSPYFASSAMFEDGAFGIVTGRDGRPGLLARPCRRRFRDQMSAWRSGIWFHDDPRNDRRWRKRLRDIQRLSRAQGQVLASCMID